MSLDTLNATLEREFSRPVRAASPSKAPSFLSGGSSGSDYDNEREAEQLEHYRGRVYAATRPIVTRIASQPVFVARRTNRKSDRSLMSMIMKGEIRQPFVPDWLGLPSTLEVVDNHSLVRALRDPNADATGFNLWEATIASLFVTGRGFLVAVFTDDQKRPLDIFSVPPTWMKRSKDSFGKFWIMKPPAAAGDGVKLLDNFVCQIKFSSPENPTACVSPLQMMARAVLTDEAIGSAQYSEFKNGLIPKVALIAGDVLNETSFTDDVNRVSAARPVRLEPFQRQQIIQWFQQQMAQSQRTGAPLVLDAIIRDIKFLSRNPEEMAFMDSSNLTKSQIYETVGISDILTGNLQGTSRAGGALAEQFSCDYVVNPLIMMLSQALTKKFGALFADKGEELVAWMAPAIPRDVEREIAHLQSIIRAYAATPNEIRSIAGRTNGWPLGWDERFESIAIPQTMDQRDEDDETMGIGRLTMPAENGKPNA